MPKRIRAIIGIAGLALILILYFLMTIPGPGNVVVLPLVDNGWAIVSVVLIIIAVLSLAALTSLLPFEKFDQIALAQIAGVWFIIVPVFIFFGVVPRPPGDHLGHIEYEGDNYHLYVDQEGLAAQEFQPDLNGQPVPVDVLNCTTVRRLFTCDSFNLFCETFEPNDIDGYQLRAPNIPADNECPAITGGFSATDEALFFTVGSETLAIQR